MPTTLTVAVSPRKSALIFSSSTAKEHYYRTSRPIRSYRAIRLSPHYPDVMLYLYYSVVMWCCIHLVSIFYSNVMWSFIHIILLWCDVILYSSCIEVLLWYDVMLYSFCKRKVACYPLRLFWNKFSWKCEAIRLQTQDLGYQQPSLLSLALGTVNMFILYSFHIVFILFNVVVIWCLKD